MAQPDAELPGYAARAPNTMEHRYQLDDSKGRPWLWLAVKSRSKDAKQLPLFFEHDTISGTVEVDLDKAEGSKGVLISVGPLHANLSCRLLAPCGGGPRPLRRLDPLSGLMYQSGDVWS